MRGSRTNLGEGTLLLGDHPCDILLIQPPIRDFYLTAKRTIPYGLLSIAAALRRGGFRVALLDALARGKSRPAPLPSVLEEPASLYGQSDLSPFALFTAYRHFGYALSTIADAAARSGAFLIGISSLFSAYEDMALACAEVVKSRSPQAFVVLGGHHPTAFPERVLHHPSVDFVLRGDGETSLPLLAQTLRLRGNLAAVPGIAFTEANGRQRISPPAYVSQLDRLPLPAVDLMKTPYYARRGKASLTIAASRGCNMTCSYCCMGAHSKIPYRRRSVAHVMQEIDHAARRREIGLIDFEDENLAVDRSWLADLMQHIERYFSGHQPELRAMNGLYPPVLDRGLIARMRSAGFRQLNLSLATCSRQQARRFHRPFAVNDFDRVIGWGEKEGLTAVGYLIAGAPGQDPLGSIDDLLFMASRRVLVGLSLFYPAPGSLDFERCRSAGLLPGSPLRWRSSAFPIHEGPRRLQSATLLRLSRILNFMKQCLDAGDGLPSAEIPPRSMPRLSGSRYERGRRLLGWFLADGRLRCVDARGRVTVCPADPVLARAFQNGLRDVDLRGVCR